jgi:hypothetical protein
MSLDALAVIGLKILGDLRFVVGALVDRDADPPIGAGHRLRLEPGQLALDVEVADLAEIEEALVKFRPQLHASAMDVVGQVIDTSQPDPRHSAIFQGREVDIVDRPLAVSVDEIDQAAADPFDGGDVELHRSDLAVHRLGAERDRALVSLSRIGNPERDGAHGRTMQPGESLGEALRFCIKNEIGVALLIEGHLLRTVSCCGDKPQALEQRRERLRVGTGIFDELEPVGSHRVVPQIAPLRSCLHRNLPPPSL